MWINKHGIGDFLDWKFVIGIVNVPNLYIVAALPRQAQYQ